MTVADYLSDLRTLTAASEEDFSDSDLLDVLTVWTDGEGVTDLNMAVAVVWEIKAGRYAELVDVTEAGSSRKLSDLSKNALAMSTKYRKISEAAVVTVAVRPRTRAIERPR